MNRRRQKKLTKRLVLAASIGELADVRTLLRAGAQPAEADNEGTTPLYAASVHGAADPVLREDYGTGYSPMDWALAGPHADVVRLLRDAGGTRSADSRAGG
ncbi:ankyrin repeat domain-containing protein [Streptomyces curacoi]|uniref:Uncharacterized protein n=1 Tax=Streptomyces curacoi TaxID=146536 RepID=A0A117P3I9_9ACTN|nr:ankyrin repeat domain-containing protein [Streptomyces curacoi]KUM72389.1 hypothetical protein AQI70_24155 [Streptomyces curacoi]